MAYHGGVLEYMSRLSVHIDRDLLRFVFITVHYCVNVMLYNISYSVGAIALDVRNDSATVVKVYPRQTQSSPCPPLFSKQAREKNPE